MEEPQYYIRQNGGQPQGPFPWSKIQAYAEQGRVRADMEFSEDGSTWWLGEDWPALFPGQSTTLAVAKPVREPRRASSNSRSRRPVSRTRRDQRRRPSRAPSFVLVALLVLLGGGFAVYLTKGDSSRKEEALQEMLAIIDEVNTVLASVRDGATAEAASPRLFELARRKSDLQDRYRDEKNEAGDEEVRKRYASQMRRAAAEFLGHVTRIAQIPDARTALDRPMRALEMDGLVKVAVSGLEPAASGDEGRRPDTRLSKREFRQRMEKLLGNSVGLGVLPGESSLVDQFGEPDRTQTIDSTSYWYYECRDGMVQIVFNKAMHTGALRIRAVNDY